jgi:exopolyphosphatase/guanosine-5'-triphosphate,3'-diphosphate pyrophosphatase
MTPSSTNICAAIDFGTVTSRLCIARVEQGAVTPLVRRSIITHMGEGLDACGLISEAAIARVLDAVAEFNKELHKMQSSRALQEHAPRDAQAIAIPVRAVATSAMRDAQNSAQVQERLAARGINVEIIEGTREAELSFRGTLSGFPLASSELAAPSSLRAKPCNPELSLQAVSGTTPPRALKPEPLAPPASPDLQRPVMTIDVGGGSTEVIAGIQSLEPSGKENLVLEQSISFDIGSRRVTERFLHSDPPVPAELDAARAWIAAEIAPFFEGILPLVPEPAPARSVFAVAGVATTAVSMLKEMTEYDPERVHGTTVSYKELSELLQRLSAVTLAQRRTLVGLHPKRASVMIGGVITLLEMLRAARAQSFIVSETDILEGILLEGLSA